MAQFKVNVKYTCEFEKELLVYAEDEDAAGEKATEIVEGWKNVIDVEILETEEN